MSEEVSGSTTALDNLKPKEVFVGEETDSEESSGARYFNIDKINVENLNYENFSTTDDEIERQRPNFECPPEYWHIQKLMKYLKTGNQTATVVALCCLKDHDLSEEVNQFAIQVTT